MAAAPALRPVLLPRPAPSHGSGGWPSAQSSLLPRPPMAAAPGPPPPPPPAPSRSGGGGGGLRGGHGGRIRAGHGGSAAAGPPPPRPPSSHALRRWNGRDLHEGDVWVAVGSLVAAGAANAAELLDPLHGSSELLLADLGIGDWFGGLLFSAGQEANEATILAILGVAASFAGKAYGQVGQGLPVAASGLAIIVGLNLLEMQV